MAQNNEYRGERDDLVRKMPASIPAERALLGSLLVDANLLPDVLTVVRADDFYVTEHKQIFLAMQELFDASREIDPVTLIDTLVHKGVYEKSGGEDYIRSLCEVTPDTLNTPGYARIVKEASARRQIISLCSEVSDISYAEQEPLSSVLDYAQGQLSEISAGRDAKSFLHIREVMVKYMARLKELADSGGKAQGTLTGFGGLDNLLLGMTDTDLIIVGARPGMGKTSFVLNIAANVAMSTEKTVCIFELEMPAQELAGRMISGEALIDSKNLRQGRLQPTDWDKVAAAAARLGGTNILIDDTSGMTATAIKAKLRNVQNLGLVVIDYLQLMEAERKSDNRAVEVGDISRKLKLLAKDLHVPVICCAQLSRDSAKRKEDSRRPQLTDLRDSGSIEQDADVVIFLHRDDYYDAQQSSENSTVEVIVQKNRHGATGKVEMNWIPSFTKFMALDTHHEE